MSTKPDCKRITKLYDLLQKSLYLCGLYNFCEGPVKFSKKFLYKYDIVNTILTATTNCFTLLLLSAFVTQRNLTTKQQADLSCNLANPVAHFYCLIFTYNRTRLRTVLYRLLVTLKQEFNDLEAEELLFSKLRKYMSVYVGSAIITIGIYGICGILQVVRSDLPFVTIITGWPDVNEVSNTASVARVIFYLYWFVSFLRLSGGYLLLLSMLIGLSSQYRNLQKYFLSLSEIFDLNLSQEHKEREFEKSFVKGVKMHAATIWCTNECKAICKIVFDTQMILAMATFLTSLSALLNPDHDFETILTNLPMSATRLVTTAFFMWNAGDISVEASGLSDAMFGSGWHNCCGDSSLRVRKMVTISMAQAQIPVQLKALGCIELSYETFLGIIKASHSLFSVFY